MCYCVGVMMGNCLATLRLERNVPYWRKHAAASGNIAEGSANLCLDMRKRRSGMHNKFHAFSIVVRKI